MTSINIVSTKRVGGRSKKSKYPRSYFKSRENQREFMELLFKHANFQSLEEWVTIPKLDIETNNNRGTSIENTNPLFSRLFNTNHIIEINKRRITENGGLSMIKYYHSNELSSLLLYVYPNFPWSQLGMGTDIKKKITKGRGGEVESEFEVQKPKKVSTSSSLLQTLPQQQKFFNELIDKLHLTSLDDLLYITNQTIIDHGGKPILQSHPHSRLTLLQTLYPHHHWSLPPPSPSSLPSSSLTSSLPRSSMSSRLRGSDRRMKTLKQQRKMMDRFYERLKLSSLDEWLKVKKTQFLVVGYKHLLDLYHHDLKKLLRSIYPEHTWNFEGMTMWSSSSFRFSTQNQKEFLNSLFHRLKLKHFEEWPLIIITSKFKQFGGEKLLRLYHFNYSLLLSSIYPNYPWLTSPPPPHATNDDHHHHHHHYGDNSSSPSSSPSSSSSLLVVKRRRRRREEGEGRKERNTFKTISQQRKFMEKLIKRLQIRYFEELLQRPLITPIKRLGGHSLLSSYYENDIEKLLSRIFPNYPWNFKHHNRLLSLYHQRKQMDRLYQKCKLSSVKDWLRVRKSKFIVAGGLPLLQSYQNDFAELLSSVYPEVNWEFSELKYRPHRTYSKSKEFLSSKLKFLVGRFAIREKKDWYRLSLKYEEIYVLHALRMIYPLEKWSKAEFIARTKKCNQRLLFVSVEQLFPQQLLLENYRHPHLCGEARLLEIDIFLPGLSLAFEYQGQQHYDDLPFAFSQLQSYQSNDLNKIQLAEKENITLLPVPYWWDFSSESLFTSVLPKLLSSQFHGRKI